MKTTPNPPNTTLLLRSRCVRPAASWASADFFRSATARFMPMPKFLRMRNSVNDAPTIMPPTAMGRTMWNQMAHDVEPDGAGNLGPAIFARNTRRQLRPQEEGQQRHQQSPGEDAAGEVQRAQPGPDNVAHAQVGGADGRGGERRHGARLHDRRTRRANELDHTLSDFADMQHKVAAGGENVDRAQEEEHRAHSHIGEEDLGGPRALLAGLINLGRGYRLRERKIGIF